MTVWSVALATPLLLGGLLSLEEAALQRWSWSGAWEYPVGRPSSPGPDSLPVAEFRLLRGFERSGRDPHRGVDFGSGRSGAAVRASAHGIVVQAVRGDSMSAWGDRVVVAHRLPDDRIVYSVYAHLQPRSIRVRAGERVRAGQSLARVGRSGNATTPHLHFEVRICRDPRQRWEKAEAVDPLAFVSARLTSCWRQDHDAARLRRWAEEGALIPIGAPGHQPLRRTIWWTMLARAARHDLGLLPASGDSLGARLAAAGLLAAGDPGDPDHPPAWREIAHDLERLRRLGLRLPGVPHPAGWLARGVGERFGGTGRPADPAHRHPPGPATVDDALLLIADAASPAPATPRRPSKPR